MNTTDFTLRPVAKPMRVLNKLEFIGQLERSVMRILEERVGKLEPRTRASILQDLRHECLAQVRHDGRRVRGVSKQEFLAGLARSRDRVLEDRDRAREELSKLKQRLDKLRATPAASARTSTKDVERRLRAQFDVCSLAGSVTLDQEREILAFANRAVVGELDRAVPEADGEVVLLERRISKLTQSLGSMEEKVRELAKLKEGDGGIASVYRSVQGLSELDEGAGHKRGLLHDIFVANQELKQALRG